MSKWFPGKAFRFAVKTWNKNGECHVTRYARRVDAVGDYELLCQSCVTGKVELSKDGMRLMSQGV